jgi:hypothetical protein
MGLCIDAEFDLAREPLPVIEAELDKNILIQHALTRRGEIILAGIASEVGRLEVFAQWSTKFRVRTQTYASTSDIHHQLIPQGSKEGEYRPDALAPEMPHHLIGNRENRTARAKALADRADSLLAKTRNLVALEATSAFVQWETATASAKLAAEETRVTKEIFKRIKPVAGDAANYQSETIEKVIRAQAAYTEARARYNEARFQQIVNLASLERITGGGLHVNYPGR